MFSISRSKKLAFFHKASVTKKTGATGHLTIAVSVVACGHFGFHFTHFQTTWDKKTKNSYTLEQSTELEISNHHGSKNHLPLPYTNQLSRCPLGTSTTLVQRYCWWKKSCTSWYRFLYIPRGDRRISSINSTQDCSTKSSPKRSVHGEENWHNKISKSWWLEGSEGNFFL